MSSTFATRIKHALTYSGLTHEEFAYKLDISDDHLTSLLAGHLAPDKEFLKQISRKFQYNYMWLLNGDEIGGATTEGKTSTIGNAFVKPSLQPFKTPLKMNQAQTQQAQTQQVQANSRQPVSQAVSPQNLSELDPSHFAPQAQAIALQNSLAKMPSKVEEENQSLTKELLATKSKMIFIMEQSLAEMKGEIQRNQTEIAELRKQVNELIQEKNTDLKNMVHQLVKEKQTRT